MVKTKQSANAVATHCENDGADQPHTGSLLQYRKQRFRLHVQSQKKQQKNNADMSNIRHQRDISDKLKSIGPKQHTHSNVSHQ